MHKLIMLSDHIYGSKAESEIWTFYESAPVGDRTSQEKWKTNNSN